MVRTLAVQLLHPGCKAFVNDLYVMSKMESHPAGSKHSFIKVQNQIGAAVRLWCDEVKMIA